MTTGGDGDDTPGYLSLFNNPAQKFYNEMQLFQVEAYADLPPSKVRDLTESWGFKMRIAAAFNKNGPWLDGIFCQCRTEAEWRGIVADKRMDICLPIMANTISLGRTLQALRMRYHASLSILDALGLAVLLVDATGNVIEHNKEAQRIIDMEDGLSLSASKRIKLCSPDKTNELEAMMNTANGLLIGNIGTVNTLMACERPSSLKNYDARRKAISFVSQRRQEFL